jgi:hypothetical protein
MRQTDPALLPAQFLPDLAVRGYDGNDSVYAGGMDGPGYILLADLDRRLAPIGLSARGHTDFYGQLLGNAANRGTVSAIYAPFEYGPSDRPIHDPRIEKEETQALANLVADSALAGRCRTVNGDGVHRNYLTKEERVVKRAEVDLNSSGTWRRAGYKI